MVNYAGPDFDIEDISQLGTPPADPTVVPDGFPKPTPETVQ